MPDLVHLSDLATLYNCGKTRLLTRVFEEMKRRVNGNSPFNQSQLELEKKQHFL